MTHSIKSPLLCPPRPTLPLRALTGFLGTLTLLSTGCFTATYAEMETRPESTSFKPGAVYGNPSGDLWIKGSVARLSDDDLVSPWTLAYVHVAQSQLPDKQRQESKSTPGNSATKIPKASLAEFFEDGKQPKEIHTNLPPDYAWLEDWQTYRRNGFPLSQSRRTTVRKPINLVWTVPLDAVTLPVQILGAALIWPFFTPCSGGSRH